MKKQILFISLMSLSVIVLPLMASAIEFEDWETQMDRVGTEVDELPTESPGTFVGKIIAWVLGLIGVILVALIVYGGFLYMTSAGNEDQVDRAKSVLTYSIIGLVVIVIAWIVSDYILSALFYDAGGTGD